MLHEVWLIHGEVGADEIAVLAVMALHAARDGTCFPSQGLLARLLGRSRPWVCKVVGRLVEIGILEKTDRCRTDGGRRTSLYRLVGPTRDSGESESPSSNIAESSASHAGDRVSTDRNSPCHTDDNVTPDQELIQDSPPACAREGEGEGKLISDIRVASVVPEITEQEIRVATTPEPNWQPSDESLVFALERFPEVDLQAMTEKFVNRCRARGYRYFDLDSAWRTWLLEDQAAAKQGEAARFGRGGRQRASAAQVRFDAWASVARAASAGVCHAA